MSEPLPVPEFDATDEQTKRVPKLDAVPASRAILKDSWPSIALGIVLAGGAYPVILSSGYVMIGFVFIVGRQLIGDPGLGHAPFLLGTALIGFVYALFLGMIGIIWSFIVALVTLPFVHAFVWSLKLREDVVWLGAFSGGVVGFIAVLPMMLRLPEIIGVDRLWPGLLMIALGPGLTTVLGQIGGAWGGWRAARRATEKAERHRALVAIGWRTDAHPATQETDPVDCELQPRFQFRIHHLLWLSLWLSLLLSVIRLSGVPFAFVLPLLIVWCVYQAATMYFGRMLLQRRVERWQRAHEPRST
jgi:hypothetical protein